MSKYRKSSLAKSTDCAIELLIGKERWSGGQLRGIKKDQLAFDSHPIRGPSRPMFSKFGFLFHTVSEEMFEEVISKRLRPITNIQV